MQVLVSYTKCVEWLISYDSWCLIYDTCSTLFLVEPMRHGYAAL